MKKKFTSLLIILIAIHGAHAQFYKTVLPSEAFSSPLSVIVQDFKKNFSSIQGDQLSSGADVEVYQSKVIIPGSLHCSIFRFHSLLDTTASWQATMYDGDSYEEAMKIYKNTVRQLTRTKMKWIDSRVVSFTGQLETPHENAGFAVTTLKLNIADKAYSIFIAEIDLTNTYSGWEVHLNLNNKKSDTDE
ncbi:MAG: hypothetical protein JWP81_3665 [Ferruginibacter sp.]|nr:hypothetical protein [Ferruginibacter sp.]